MYILLAISFAIAAIVFGVTWRQAQVQLAAAKQSARIEREQAGAEVRNLRHQLNREQPVWRSVFVDEFERTELGDQWAVQHGEWRLQDGRLRCVKKEPQSVIYCLGTPFSGDIRVTYRCRTLDGYRNNACDMSFFTHSRKDTKHWNSGYLWRFGSYGNTWSGLDVGGHTIAKNPDVRIQPKRDHTVTIERVGTMMTFLVDDTVVVRTYEHSPAPDAFTAGGFYVYKSIVEFDYIVVSKPMDVPPAANVHVETELF